MMENAGLKFTELRDIDGSQAIAQLVGYPIDSESNMRDL